jgi:hypothetical protein
MVKKSLELIRYLRRRERRACPAEFAGPFREARLAPEAVPTAAAKSPCGATGGADAVVSVAWCSGGIDPEKLGEVLLSESVRRRVERAVSFDASSLRARRRPPAVGAVGVGNARPRGAVAGGLSTPGRRGAIAVGLTESVVPERAD